MTSEAAPERFRMVRVVARLAALAAWGIVVVFFGATLIRGGSMEPAVVPGDVVVYRRSAADIRVGDIVYFEHPEWPRGVVHRVAEVLPDGSVRTRGDANAADDRDPVPRRRIRGVGTAVIPLGKALGAAAEAFR